MKNIHVLPTDKPSRLFLNKKNNTLFINEQFDESSPKIIALNIYITSDEKIKVGDWVLYTGGNRIHYQKLEDKNDVELANIEDSGAFKIILTTDQDLIKDGVQAIDDEFLNWFVKNPSCEEVEIDYGFFTPSGKKVDPMGILQNHSKCVWIYKIIIPKEEPKQDLEKEMFELEEQLDIPSHLRWHNSKPKQETLEQKQETLEQMINILPKKYAENLDLFLKGMQYQKDQDKNKYSDEEVLELIQFLAEREDFKENSSMSIFIAQDFLQKFKNK